MTQVLEADGFRVQSVQTAAAAKRIDLSAIDLIVSDLGLPDQNGLDLIGELQVDRRCPALALSGFCMEADVLASLHAGFDAHLKKPVDVNTLLSAIRTLVPGRP